jgi:hypothetical protein
MNGPDGFTRMMSGWLPASILRHGLHIPQGMLGSCRIVSEISPAQLHAIANAVAVLSLPIPSTPVLKEGG